MHCKKKRESRVQSIEASIKVVRESSRCRVSVRLLTSFEIVGYEMNSKEEEKKKKKKKKNRILRVIFFSNGRCFHRSEKNSNTAPGRG